LHVGSDLSQASMYRHPKYPAVLAHSVDVMKFQCRHWVIFRKYVPQYFSEDGA
jgi:hypothetical protein